jgi:hypothetical protein
MNLLLKGRGGNKDRIGQSYFGKMSLCSVKSVAGNAPNELAKEERKVRAREMINLGSICERSL